MKIPKTVKIGWRVYTVKLVPDLIDEDGNPVNGLIDFVNHIIYIDNDLIYEDEKKFTFLHEVAHGIYHGQSHTEWRDNEDLVNATAEGIFQLMKDNPKIFEK